MSTVSGYRPGPEQLTADDRALLQSVHDQFLSMGARPLFTTDATPWPVFLNAMPAALRQVYTCRACQHFVERYGGLVALTPSGATEPAMWGSGPAAFGRALTAVAEHVAHAKITGVFLSSDLVWGTPVTGVWEHFAVRQKEPFAHALLSAEQAMAAKKEEYGMLQRGLADYPAPVLRQAVNLLQAGDALYRSEKVLGVAAWLLSLRTLLDATKNARHRAHVVWSAVAIAPPGYAHVRTTMVHTLLDDLAAGLPMTVVQKNFADKMHPLRYRRPTAAPRAQQIDRAEHVVQTLGAAGSFNRRVATLADCTPLWTAAPLMDATHFEGIFDHLKARAQRVPAVDAPETKITWAKFRQTVLPSALEIECEVPNRGHFITLTTAVDPAAPPVLQWDTPERRNPVSWFLYHTGAPADLFNLRGGQWRHVPMICLLPCQWGQDPPVEQWSQGAILMLEGARNRSSNMHSGLFPECLRSEFHAVRQTIEAHNRHVTVAGADVGSACGLDLRKGNEWNVRVRVSSTLGRAIYRLDRWD